jgi:hypothetical protein
MTEADPNRGWMPFRNDSKTYKDEDGVEQYGVYEWGYRNPENHHIVFSGKSSDGEAPKESVREHMENLATPKAQERAAEVGVDVSTLSGSGSGGKVTVPDVEKAAKE